MDTRRKCLFCNKKRSRDINSALSNSAFVQLDTLTGLTIAPVLGRIFAQHVLQLKRLTKTQK